METPTTCHLSINVLDSFARSFQQMGAHGEARRLVMHYRDCTVGDAEEYINNDFKTPIKLESRVFYSGYCYIVKGMMNNHGVGLLWLQPAGDSGSVQTARKDDVVTV